MKKTIILATICLIFSQCRKDFQCECTTTNLSGGMAEPKKEAILIQVKNRADAEKACETHEEVSNSFKTECHISP